MAAERAPAPFAERGPVRVAVVVLNYRTPELAVACAASAVADADPERDLVLLVDNASGDGSAAALRNAVDERSWPNAHVLEAEANRGFAAGNNLGMRSVDARAYLLLNSDTQLRPGTIDRLTEVLEADPAVGVVSPRLEDPDGTPQTSCFRFHTPWSELAHAAQTAPLSRLLRCWEVALGVREEPFEPDWTSFAAVLLARRALERAGPLDEGFFMYYEDADYCRRVWRAGLRVRHEPRARVVHLRGGSSPVKALTAARRRRPAYYYASRNRYFTKAHGAPGRVLANLLRTAGCAVARLRDALGGRRQRSIEGEWRDLWRRA